MKYLLAIALISIALTPCLAQQQLVFGDLPQPGEQLRNYLFYDYALEIHKLEDLYGSKVILVFWQPGDANSIALLKQLDTATFTGANPPKIVAISLDAKTGDALFEITKLALDSIQFLDGDKYFLAQYYGVTGVPTVFVVDETSHLIKAFLGYDDQTMARIIAALK